MIVVVQRLFQKVFEELQIEQFSARRSEIMKPEKLEALSEIIRTKIGILETAQQTAVKIGMRQVQI